MRIDNYGKFSDPVVQSAQSAKKGAGAKGAGSAGGSAGAPGSTSAEKVTVSAQAQALSHQATTVDAAKVERLRSAIQSGTFKVDKQAIANRIVDGE